MSPSLLTACGQYNGPCIGVVIHTAAAFHHLKFVTHFLCALFTMSQWSLSPVGFDNDAAFAEYRRHKEAQDAAYHLFPLPKRRSPDPPLVWNCARDRKTSGLTRVCLPASRLRWKWKFV